MTPDKAGGTPTPLTDAFYREHPILEYEQLAHPADCAAWLDFAGAFELALQERTAERDYCMTKGEQWEQRASTLSQQLLSVRAERDIAVEAIEQIHTSHDAYCEHHIGVSQHSRDLAAIADEARHAIAAAVPPRKGEG